MESERQQKKITDAVNVHRIAIQKLDKAVDQHAQVINSIRQQVNKHDSTYSNAVESTARYNSIVVGIGYAGFFGLWSMIRDQAPQSPTLHALAALLVSVSLMVFVFWEVSTMWARTVVVAYQRPVALGQTRTWRLANWIQEREMRVWPWQFGIALLTGLVGMCLLVASIGHQLYAAVCT